MKLLLDTHIWLWSIGDPTRLGRRTLEEITSSENELWVSPASVWEALTLHAKKRVDLGSDIEAWFAGATAATREAPFTHEIAKTATRMEMHKDPADRFLAATALVLDMTLVTADDRLLGLGVIRTLGNR